VLSSARDAVLRDVRDLKQVAAETTLMRRIPFVLFAVTCLIDSISAQSGGGEVLDLAARRALVLTGQLPPLPPAFTEKPLVVRLVFDVR